MTKANVTSIIITTMNGDLQRFGVICNTSVILNTPPGEITFVVIRL